jgi:hypothetical protein
MREELLKLANECAAYQRNKRLTDYWRPSFAALERRLRELADGRGEGVEVECRQCDNCNHAGINDMSATAGACFDCDWRGPEQAEDHCPGCGRHGTMTAACPRCGSRYTLIASANLPPSPEPPTAAPRADGSDWLDYAATPAEHEQRRKHFAAQATTDAGREDAEVPKLPATWRGYMRPPSDAWERGFGEALKDCARDLEVAIAKDAKSLTPAGGEDGRDAVRLRFVVEHNWMGTKTRCERGIQDSDLASARDAIDAAIAAERGVGEG